MRAQIRYDKQDSQRWLANYGGLLKFLKRRSLRDLLFACEHPIGACFLDLLCVATDALSLAFLAHRELPFSTQTPHKCVKPRATLAQQCVRRKWGAWATATPVSQDCDLAACVTITSATA